MPSYNREELVRIYREADRSDDVIIEILGEPVVALKQMKAEPWALRERDQDESAGSE